MLNRANIDLEAVREAIASLSLLKPEAEETMISLMPPTMFLHPRQICTQYRKAGEQLSRDEKRLLGLRSNAFMSKDAAAQLSSLGSDRPLEAHELTLMRAIFTRQRYRSIASAHRAGRDDFKIDCLNMSRCGGCRRLGGRMVRGYQAEVMPPSDCETETCNMGVDLHVDFIGEYILKERGDCLTLQKAELQAHLDGLFIFIRDATPRDTPGSHYFNFDFTCGECGSETASTDTGPDGTKVCKCPECGKIFGRWVDVEALARVIANIELSVLTEHK